MNKKVQLLILGILLGFFFSGILFLFFMKPFFSPQKTIILSTPQSSSTSISSRKIYSASTINLNTCTKEELMSIPGIGEAKATSIITFRDKYGDFKEINELLYVPGIGSNLFEEISPYLVLE